jgi:lactoylglutathione lyase
LRTGTIRCNAYRVASKIFPMLSCSDLTRSLAFYADLLGGVESYRFPDDGEPAFIALTLGESSEIGLGGIAAEPLHGRQQRPASGHRVELCVYVEDVDHVYARARADGFEAVAAPADMPWGERIAWLADPDGNLVMLTR